MRLSVSQLIFLVLIFLILFYSDKKILANFNKVCKELISKIAEIISNQNKKK